MAKATDLAAAVLAQGQLPEFIGIDNNAELREIAELSTAVEFSKWTTSPCVGIIGVFEP